MTVRNWVMGGDQILTENQSQVPLVVRVTYPSKEKLKVAIVHECGARGTTLGSTNQTK